MRRYSWQWLIQDNRGGGSKPQPTQVIPAPTPPSVADTAKQSAEAQLTYNPQLTAQSVQLQGQYGPQLAQQQYDLQAQYAPLYRALIERQFPQVGTLAQQTQQGLTNPSGLSDVQQQAQDAIRQRQRDELSRTINTQSNIGGTLYGGRNQENVMRAQTELSNQYANSDIALQQQQRSQNMQELLSLFQMAGFNVQQPTVPQFGQNVVPSGDNLYNAMVQNQGNFGVIPGTSGSSGAWGGIGAAAGAAGVKLMFMCLPGWSLIDLDRGQTPIRDVQTGDRIGEFTVLMKYEYMSIPTPFVQLEFSDGTLIETCDKHLIDGKGIQLYSEGDELQGRLITRKSTQILTEKTYDLLTDAPDGGYLSSGIHIPSMIPTLHKAAHLMMEIF